MSWMDEIPEASDDMPNITVSDTPKRERDPRPVSIRFQINENNSTQIRMNFADAQNLYGVLREYLTDRGLL